MKSTLSCNSEYGVWLSTSDTAERAQNANSGCCRTSSAVHQAKQAKKAQCLKRSHEGWQLVQASGCLGHSHQKGAIARLETCRSEQRNYDSARIQAALSLSGSQVLIVGSQVAHSGKSLSCYELIDMVLFCMPVRTCRRGSLEIFGSLLPWTKTASLLLPLRLSQLSNYLLVFFHPSARLSLRLSSCHLSALQ